MKHLLRILCLAVMTLVLGGCTPISKIHLHGVTNISSAANSAMGSNVQDALTTLLSQSGTKVPVIITIDAENELGLNVKATEATFSLTDGKKVYATATLSEPVTLRHKTRANVEVPMDIKIEGGILQSLSLVRKLLNSPESMTVQGEVVGKCAGVKKKKVLSPRPLSEFMSNFARK